jgi:tetratricopeptide (TPR) repeat protein
MRAKLSAGTECLIRVALALTPLLGLGNSSAVESDPLPIPKESTRATAVKFYNDGVLLLLSRNFLAAQRLFEQALMTDETLAEAHNNLAYCLRMQGTHNHDRSLQHYNRAIELKPALAQAYMYRGVLFSQMGDLIRARSDHARLLSLDAAMAAQLERVITSPTGDTRSGIAGQFDY